MTTVITSNNYVSGKRVATQEVTYTKSEDLFYLANLQRQYEDIQKNIAENTEEPRMERLIQERTRIETERAAQQLIVDNYPA